ncbi:tetratricopeptide repeat protein [Winogradskyella ursingii]|uniref:tetratricopeptide repeat protein n=1 Tax=Winogradskyella ursingii TaxID=2686079 RepID=UPI0015CE6227|nr:tetratricopeptide repeat protein [Winogradskyella ursingii]
MKFHLFIITLLIGFTSVAQTQDKTQLKAQKRATDLVYKANELVEEDNYVEAEMEYRKALSEAPNKTVGAYNLAHSYYKKGSYDEALFRTKEAARTATTKDEKHRAFHNLGNILMQNELCKEAVEAFKNALRNNPKDEETRYNYALAKDCADQQKDGGGEDDKEDKDKEEEKDKEKEQEKEDENKDNKDEGDNDKKEGDEEEDEKGKPKDDKKEDGNGDKDKKDEKPKPKPGQMSPQQIKNILEAMQNQEQKVQEKMNAEKQKGAKVKTEKDW